MKTCRVTAGQMEDGGTACQGGQCDIVSGKVEVGRRWYQGGRECCGGWGGEVTWTGQIYGLGSALWWLIEDTAGRPGWRRGDRAGGGETSRHQGRPGTRSRGSGRRVEKVGLPGAGAEWPRAAREGEGGVCGNLPLGVLGKRTGSLMGLVTNMDSAGSGEGCAQYWPDCNGGS